LKNLENPQIPLDKFQQWMQQMLLDPFQKTEVDPTDILPASFKSTSLEAVVNHSDRLPALEHLAIYQRSYIARLRNCMSQQFSALEYALGEDLFCAFADDYLASQPSQNYNLTQLGAEFPNYLEANRPDIGEEAKEDWIDFIIELAKFEFDIGLIFEEKAEEGYNLATSETAETRLQLVPVFYLFQFQFPTRWFYTEFKNGNEPNLPHADEGYAVVLRHNFKLAIYDLHKEQFDFLRILKQGNNIEESKNEFLKTHNVDAFEKTWPIWKERWIGAKFFRTN
jgi:hypothetical protein